MLFRSNDTATTEIYTRIHTLSLHDALPISNNDIETLRKFGVKILVTTTPEMNGRSFGANVLQAIFVSILEKRPENILPEEYLHLMDILGIQPRVIYL